MRYAVFFAIIAIMAQSLGRTIILVNFKLNQAYIAQVLCENKTAPEMNCNGQCQLSKQMEKAETEEKQLPPSYQLRDLLLFKSENRKNGFGDFQFSTNKMKIAIKRILFSCDFFRQIFHPPNL